MKSNNLFSKENVAIIIPGYNEAQYIRRVLLKTKKYSSHIVFVDDGSTDKSAVLARKITPHVLRHQVNLGKGSAMKTGAEYAFEQLHASAIIFIDADDQHDPAEIPKFIEQLSHSDAVFGVRKMGTSMPLTRYLGNKVASVLLNILYGRYIEDIPSGYKAMTRGAYVKIYWNSSGYEVETEIAARAIQEKLRLTFVGIEAIYHDTDKGMTLLDAVHIVRCLLLWKLGM